MWTIVIVIKRQKALKKFNLRTWCIKKSFGYRVILYGYSLMSVKDKNKFNLEQKLGLLVSFKLYTTVNI